jgi:hypothetical protein
MSAARSWVLRGQDFASPDASSSAVTPAICAPTAGFLWVVAWARSRAHELRDKTAEARQHRGHATVISADHRARTFRIEACRQFCGADDGTEHDRQQLPLSSGGGHFGERLTTGACSAWVPSRNAAIASGNRGGVRSIRHRARPGPQPLIWGEISASILLSRNADSY